MAPAKGDNRRGVQGRKHLIQPILPALPVLPSRPNKHKPSGQSKPEPAQTQQPEHAELHGGETRQEDAIPQKQASEAVEVAADPPSAVEELKKSSSESVPVSKEVLEIEESALLKLDEQALPKSLEADAYETLSSGLRLPHADSESPTTNAENSDSHHLAIQDHSTHSYVNGVQEWAEEVSDEVAKESLENKQQDFESVQRNGVSSSGMSEHDTSVPEINGDATHESGIHVQNFDTVNGTSTTAKGLQFPILHSQESEPVAQSGNTTSGQLSSISEHLLQLSATRDWADWVLTVSLEGVEIFATFGHGLVLLRSPRLHMLMEQSRTANFTGNVISLNPPQSIVSHAFEAALRFLYSDTVLSTDSLLPKAAGQDLGLIREGLLSYIISYWISGIELGIEPVVTRSAKLFEDFIAWDIAELAMKQAYELETSVIRGLPDQQLLSSYADAAVRMQQAILRFCVRHIGHSGFQIQNTASPTFMRSRLGQLEETRTRHNPALASMVFGSMPSSADLSPASPQSEILPVASSLEDQVASSILLNVSFENLEYFAYQLVHAQGTAAEVLLSRIVEEREARRLKVVSNRNIPNKQRMSNSTLWDIAGFREFLQDGKIRRERVGFVLPTRPR